MLRQEINLYRQFVAPVTSATYFTWKRYLILNGFFTVLLFIIYFASIFQTVYLRREADQLQLQISHYKDDFQKLKNSFPQLFFSENISDSVAGIKKQMEAQKKIVGILSKHSPFSDILQGLSRTIIPSVWLTTITINKNGEKITLDGNSLGLTRINDYLASLGKDKAFSNFAIVVHEVKNNDAHDPNIRSTFIMNMDKIEHE